MSIFINELTLMGYLGKNPEKRFFPNGDSMVRLTLATSERWVDAETGEQRESTEWHSALLYKKAAEIAEKYLAKGDLVWLRGKIKKRTWINKKGESQSTTDLVVQEMKFFNTKNREVSTSKDENSGNDLPKEDIPY